MSAKFEISRYDGKSRGDECAQMKDFGEVKIFAAVEESGRESSQEYPVTARGVIRLRGLTRELRITQEEVESHSESASRLAKDLVYRARTKHVGVRHRELREFSRGGGSLLREISCRDFSADLRGSPALGVGFKSGLDSTHSDAR